MLPTVQDYGALITSWHATRPKFVETVEANVTPPVALDAALYSFIREFDLDYAVGAQLDVIGQWIGRSRQVLIPLANPWFAFDSARRGFDRGVWIQPYETGSYITTLDDDTYRRLLRAKIAFNGWDGLTASAETAIRNFFVYYPTFIWLEDRADMSVAYCFVGAWPDLVGLVMISNQYIEINAAAVTTHYQIASVEHAPLFGLDCANQNVAGLDAGAWGVTPALLIDNLI